MECLKEIRKTMTEEYKYYDKTKVQTIMWNNRDYHNYFLFIQDAFVKQTSPTAYKTLSSNLYDVSDYASFHFHDLINKTN